MIPVPPLFVPQVGLCLLLQSELVDHMVRPRGAEPGAGQSADGSLPLLPPSHANLPSSCSKST